jgi:hypothetical protein
MDFIGIHEHHPIAGIVLRVQLQTHVARRGKTAKRRTIDDQPPLPPEPASFQRFVVRRPSARIIVDEQQICSIGDRIEHRSEERLFSRSQDEMCGDARSGAHDVALRCIGGVSAAGTNSMACRCD